VHFFPKLHPPGSSLGSVAPEPARIFSVNPLHNLQNSRRGGPHIDGAMRARAARKRRVLSRNGSASFTTLRLPQFVHSFPKVSAGRRSGSSSVARARASTLGTRCIICKTPEKLTSPEGGRAGAKGFQSCANFANSLPKTMQIRSKSPETLPVGATWTLRRARRLLPRLWPTNHPNRHESLQALPYSC
jgi:hypothetical protein